MRSKTSTRETEKVLFWVEGVGGKRVFVEGWKDVQCYQLRLWISGNTRTEKSPSDLWTSLW
jgi:hypothetical protein